MCVASTYKRFDKKKRSSRMTKYTLYIRMMSCLVFMRFYSCISSMIPRIKIDINKKHTERLLIVRCVVQFILIIMNVLWKYEKKGCSRNVDCNAYNSTRIKQDSRTHMSSLVIFICEDSTVNRISGISFFYYRIE